MATKVDKDTAEILESDGQYKLSDNERKEPEVTVDDIPQYRIKLDLSDDQKKRLTDQFRDEFQAIIDERQELGLPDKWQELDALYDGEMKKNSKLAFNLHVHQAKIKEDAIVRALNESVLDSEPMVDISPRPGFSLQNGQEVCDRQTAFIEYSIQTEVRPHKDMVLINHDAVRKFVGIGKVVWDYKKDRRKREEVYEGKNEPMMGANGQPVMNPQTGMPVIENKALKEFLNNYPDAETRYPNYVKQISEGKKVRLVVTYFDVVSNNPALRWIPIEKFYVRNSCKYNHGLTKEHLVVEEQPYTWFELQAKEDNDEFEDIDSIRNTDGESGEAYKYAEYQVFEATTFFKLNEEDDEEIKVKAWFGVKSGLDEAAGESENKYVLLGSIYFPYFGFDIDYIGFWVKLNKYGFYGDAKSVTWDLKHTNIAADALLNLALHSGYIRNILTPIVREGSDLEAQFIENRWLDGKPISIDMLTDDISKEFGFVQYPAFDLNGLLALNGVVTKIGDDVTGVSSLMTGRENPADPRAPATKTIALLNQAGVNIKDYVRIYAPSFNIFIEDLLQLYYQMSQEERKFRVNRKGQEVTGGDLFQSIPREMMIAKTTIQCRAAAFAFDKVNEKQENMAMFQVIQSNPYLLQKPEVMFAALKILLKSWSPTWKSFADGDLPSPAQFQGDMQQAVVMAVQQIFRMKEVQKQVTGADAPPPTPEEMMAAAGNAKAIKYNPTLAQPPKGKKR